MSHHVSPCLTMSHSISPGMLRGVPGSIYSREAHDGQIYTHAEYEEWKWTPEIQRSDAQERPRELTLREHNTNAIDECNIEIHGNPGKSVEIHGHPWKSMEIHPEMP